MWPPIAEGDPDTPIAATIAKGDADTTIAPTIAKGRADMPIAPTRTEGEADMPIAHTPATKGQADMLIAHTPATGKFEDADAILLELVEVLDEVSTESLMEMLPEIETINELLEICSQLIDGEQVTTPEPQVRQLTFSSASSSPILKSTDDDQAKVEQEHDVLIRTLFGSQPEATESQG